MTLRSTHKAYVYAIEVDGEIRYIGKGQKARLFAHAIEASRSAARCGKDTAHLYPRMHRKLVEAVRRGSAIVERLIAFGLSDAEAYFLEHELIVAFHQFRTDQLWNTIDERIMDRSKLPDDFADPEFPLYKVPRPLEQNFTLAYAAWRTKKRRRRNLTSLRSPVRNHPAATN